MYVSSVFLLLCVSLSLSLTHTHTHFPQHTVLTAVKSNIVCLVSGVHEYWEPGRPSDYILYSVLFLSIELFHVTLLAPGILSLLLDFWKICEMFLCIY